MYMHNGAPHSATVWQSWLGEFFKGSTHGPRHAPYLKKPFSVFSHPKQAVCSTFPPHPATFTVDFKSRSQAHSIAVCSTSRSLVPPSSSVHSSFNTAYLWVNSHHCGGQEGSKTFHEGMFRACWWYGTWLQVYFLFLATLVCRNVCQNLNVDQMKYYKIRSTIGRFPQDDL